MRIKIWQCFVVGGAVHSVPFFDNSIPYHCIANDILADFLREQGGSIVSILATEYDVEIAKKYYAEERVEEKSIEIAKNLLKTGDSIDKVVMVTGLTYEEVENLRDTN